MDIQPKSWKAKTITPATSGNNAGRNIVVFDNIDAVKNLKFPYRIDFLLSIVCVEGSITLTVDLKDCTITKRSLMVLRPGHTISNYNATPDFKGFFVVVTLGALNGALPSLSRILPTILHFLNNSVIHISESQLETQQRLHTLLHDKIHSEDYPYKEKVIQSLCETIFYETLSIYTSQMEANPGTSIKRKDDILYQFLALVENNFHRHRDVAYYAGRMCISPKHMSTIVKSVSGRTASEWIDSYVILEAKLLLRNTAMTVQEISTLLNFPDSSFFGKYFKRLTGTTPRKFRLIDTSIIL